jgi:UDP-GlcNAc:undecaprenyl-phosphate/decaprenyl-phosphate GlcNAc-1-phosphate transferase
MAAWISTAEDLAACFLAALALAAALTPGMERLALSVGAVDQPTDRKRHRRPTPLLGGLAILLAFWIAVLVLRTQTGFPLWGLAAAASLVTLVGLWDDLCRLSVSVRLVTQAVAAALVVTTVGAATLFGEDGAAHWANVALTFLWIVGVTNALNLIDNMDGVAAAITATAAISYAALLLGGGDVTAAGLATALAGAAIGFLSFNYPPARLFMGDAGSFFLGLTLAVLGIEAQRSIDHSAGWIPAVLILALPLSDTSLVIVSRLRRGKNPLTTPGRDHLAHRLVRLGWSDRKIVAVFTAVTAILGVCAFFAADLPAVAWAAGGVALAAGAAALVWLEREPS